MRLKVIYIPKGRALEYSDYALNIYNGCDYGCKYCFAPAIARRERDAFHTDILEKANFLSNVESDCKKLTGTHNKILLCFTTDPYNSLDLTMEITRKVLELFKLYNINFQILTKGGSRARRDFDLYKEGDALAMTLTFADDVLGREWEPNAPLASDRLATLKEAHERGIETWVSLEPVISPAESLKLIELTHDYVDFYKVGKLNHHELETTIDWKKFGLDAIALLEKYKKGYYIKADLKVYLDT